MLTEVLPRANRSMVTNNLTVLTEVSANRNRANRGVAVLCYTSVELYQHRCRRKLCTCANVAPSSANLSASSGDVSTLSADVSALSADVSASSTDFVASNGECLSVS